MSEPNKREAWPPPWEVVSEAPAAVSPKNKNPECLIPERDSSPCERVAMLHRHAYRAKADLDLLAGIVQRAHGYLNYVGLTEGDIEYRCQFAASEIVTLRQQVKEVAEERDELRSQLEAVKLECGVSKEACQTLREDSQEATSESIVHPYTDDHPEVKTRLPHDRLDALESRMQNLETRWLAASEHMSRSRALWTDRWVHHARCLDAHGSELEALRLKVVRLEEQLGQAEQAGEAPKPDPAAEERADDLLRENRGLRQKSEELASELHDSRLKVKCLEAECEANAEHTQSITRERTQIAEELAQLKTTFAQFMQDSAAARQSVEDELQLLKLNYKSREEYIERLKSALDEARADQLDAGAVAKRKICDLAAALDRANEVRHSAEEQNAKLVSENQVLRKRAADSPLPRSFYTAKDVDLAQSGGIDIKLRPYLENEDK